VCGRVWRPTELSPTPRLQLLHAQVRPFPVLSHALRAPQPHTQHRATRASPGGSHTRSLRSTSHCTTSSTPPARGVLDSTSEGVFAGAVVAAVFAVLVALMSAFRLNSPNGSGCVCVCVGVEGGA
jgi:hypothetical protein